MKPETDFSNEFLELRKTVVNLTQELAVSKRKCSKYLKVIQK